MKKLLLVGLTVLGAVSFAGENQNSERALIAYMRVTPGSEARFLKEAEDVIEQSRAESGNLMYQLHQSVTNPSQFVFYELFKTNDDLQYHRNAVHTKAFLARTKPITEAFVLEEYAPNGELLAP